MQYLIIVLIVLVAAALVIVPLVRAPRGAAVGDLDEPAPPRERPEEADMPDTTPERTAPPSSAPQPPGETGAEELPQSAPPPSAPARPLGATAGAGRAVADPATEEQILRYREALRARTICGYCSTANPPGSKYCKECGEQLGPDEAESGRGVRA